MQEERGALAGVQMPFLNMKQASDDEWIEWLKVQKAALKEDMAGAVDAAIETVDAFLALVPKLDIRCDALAYRADLKIGKEELDAAASDLREARKLSAPASYRRYTIELTLAGLAERTRQPEEAVSWYLRALETVSGDPETSGGSALADLLSLRDYSSLEADHRELCLKVARQGWKLFQLPGEPDASDLSAVAQVLIDASTRPLPLTH